MDLKRALWAVRSSIKDSGYPNEITYIESSSDRDIAVSEYKKSHQNHTLWSFDFVNYMKENKNKC